VKPDTPTTADSAQLAHYLVVIPTYNERENIEAIIDRVLALDAAFRVLVVDDNSPDGTGKLVDRLSAENDRVCILHRPAKAGLGPAYIAGFRAALATDADIILQMDADFQHNPADLVRLARALDEADVSIGSRRTSGGGSERWPWYRRLISSGGSFLARTVLAPPVRDMTSGFKAFRRSVLETVPLESVKANGFAFQIEMTYLCHQYGFRLVEVPITFGDRLAGQSKMGTGIVVEALWTLARLRLQSIVRPGRLFPRAGLQRPSGHLGAPGHQPVPDGGKEDPKAHPNG
jgi:dolichol-phosphate mannosyltransferase